MSIGIDVQYSIAHVHTQNGLAESFYQMSAINCYIINFEHQNVFIARGHAIIHATNLIHLRPTANQDLSSLQLFLCYQPNISHLRVFGCVVYVSLAPTHRTKLSPQCCLSIYVDFQYSFIINYIETLTCEVCTARLADCHFNEDVFPPLEGEKSIPEEW